MWAGVGMGGGEDGGGREGRRAARRFLISAEPLLHFLEPDAVFCGGKVRLVGGRGGRTQSATPVYPSYLATYMFPSFLCAYRENTHGDSGFDTRQIFAGCTRLHGRLTFRILNDLFVRSVQTSCSLT